MNIPTPACGNCRFSLVQWGHQERFMICRRRAPVLVGTSERPHTDFPRTDERSWCGEHEPALVQDGDRS